MHQTLRWFVLMAVAMAGCEAGGGGFQSAPRNAANNQSTGDAAASPTGNAVVYIDGEPFTDAQLAPALYEVAGETILTERILDQQIKRRLAEAGLTVTDDDLTAERRIMRQTLSADDNQSTRLLQQLRRRRGLGEQRFKALLHRNAAMRKLVQDEVVVSESAIGQAYEQSYGPLYEARLIVVDSAAKAADLARQARQGADFTTLAIAHSNDASRAQGGLIGPISPADPTWPDALRDAVIHLKPQEISPPIVLDKGFAVLKLESKTERSAPPLADVKEELARQVRRQVERIQMERLARTMLESADVVVLDASLQRAWRQRER